MSGVQHDAPPLFIAAAIDDEMVPVAHSLILYNDWVQFKHSVELHLFSKGGHGFALRMKDLPVNEWPNLFLNWMNVQGLLKR
jgi:dipeptidyl aminopeptidase/acylaminoacyl peptidase